MKPNDPSPAEIALACREIQQTWSNRERLSRMRVDWRPSYQRCDGVNEEMTSEAYSGHHATRAELQEAPGKGKQP